MSTPPSPFPQSAGTILLPGVLRTAVPMIYAFLVHRGVVEWLGLDSAIAENAITIVVTMLFYVVLRVAERYWDKIGWLLGYGKQPVYVKGEVVDVVDEVAGEVEDEAAKDDAEEALDEPVDEDDPLF